jgi:hypothetical protein
MHGTITLEGIDKALSQLRKRSTAGLKSRFLAGIRAHYEGVTVIESIGDIDTDTLVIDLWETGDDPIVIKNRRKNLQSIKSSINAELIKLYRNGKNPEGIVIGPGNIFIMSDEARDNVFKSITDRAGPDDMGSSLDHLKHALESVSDLLAQPSALPGLNNSIDPEALRDVQCLIRELTETMGLGDLDHRRPGDGIGHGHGDNSGAMVEMDTGVVDNIPIEDDGAPEPGGDIVEEGELIDIVDDGNEPEDLETIELTESIDPDDGGDVSDAIDEVSGESLGGIDDGGDRNGETVATGDVDEEKGSDD